ncbi:MAG: DNA translocase FtsK [Dehalococcoidales bacterium]|nr:DNA translocase FtsK [Dehalococcoidales bacterium]
MAKKGRNQRGSGGNFFRFMARKPVWITLLIIIIGLVVWLQWGNITNGLNSAAANIWGSLGWGIILIILFLFVLTIIILIKRVPAFLRGLKITGQILGAVGIIFGIWGVLGFISEDLGGRFGVFLIGAPNFWGVLRIIGYFVVGVFLLMPVNSCRAIAAFFRWVSRRLQRHPSMETAAAPTYSESLKATPKVMPPENAKTGGGLFRPVKKLFVSSEPITPVPERQEVKPTPVKPVPQAQSPQDLKQVAQDVWKKYGESSSLVTVDGWKLPPIEILDHAVEVELSPADNEQRAKLIEQALESYGVEGKVVQINPGPTVTQFGIEPGWDRKTREVREKDRDGNYKVRQEEISRTRVKVDRITSLANDLALTLSAPSLRIEAPVPGKGIVGIEVPNVISSVVSLRDVVETSSFQKLKAKSKLTLGLGKGAGGEAMAGDLAKMPHLLIAGATGSGKTVCLNTIICSLLLHNTPDEVQFMMVDPKRVELTPFNSIPHLAAPVIVDAEKAIIALRWLSQEMDRRYKVMASDNTRNIEGYNKNKTGTERMPFLVLIIDELADLMMTSGNEVEHNLCRLAQLARATGIHLVVATQRPSVDVITGLIKANFPTRISFAVTSQVDSRTILDSVGAEKLLGKGDMLYAPTDADKPKRLQGCYMSDPEVERLVYFWNCQQQKERKPPLNIEEITLAVKKEDESADPLMEEARKLAKEHSHISTSFLQRRLRIGYPRAARIMDQLEEEGVDTLRDEEGEEPH